MKRRIFKTGIWVALMMSASFLIGCNNKSSTSSQRAAARTNQAYCDPNRSANCNYQGVNGLNNYDLNNSCGANNIMTDYGCRPRGNCPANYGYDQQTNQCLPAAQYNSGYYQQGYYDPYYQNSYNGNYDNAYQNYNNSYNQNGYYDPYYYPYY